MSGFKNYPDKDRLDLPELPPGYFWRIKPFLDKNVDVQLRKKFGPFSTQVDAMLAFDKGDIEYSARQLARQLSQDLENNITSYCGDYFTPIDKTKELR